MLLKFGLQKTENVHISEGKPVPHATKVWITKDGKCSLANNNLNKLNAKTKKHAKARKFSN